MDAIHTTLTPFAAQPLQWASKSFDYEADSCRKTSSTSQHQLLKTHSVEGKG